MDDPKVGDILINGQSIAGRFTHAFVSCGFLADDDVLPLGRAIDGWPPELRNLAFDSFRLTIEADDPIDELETGIRYSVELIRPHEAISQIRGQSTAAYKEVAYDLASPELEMWRRYTIDCREATVEWVSGQECS